MASFLEQYLSRRLNEQLRYGERKAVYGISVFNRARGRASELTARVKPAELSFARRVIDSEIAALRDGTVSDSQFVRERDIAIASLRTTYNTGAAIDRLVFSRLYSRDVYSAFPDLVQELAALSRKDVVLHAARLFDRRRMVTTVSNVAPVSESVAVAIGLLLFAAVLVAARAFLTRPLPMASLRYVARIRRPYVHRLVATALIVIVAFAVLRLAAYPIQRFHVSTLVQVPSVFVQWSAFAVAALLPLVVVIAIRARVPAKVLVFERGMAIKAYGYRSEYVPAAEIAEVTLTTLPALYSRIGVRGFLRMRIMAPALLSPALYVRRVDGRGWLLRSRQTAELQTALERMREG